MSKIAEKRAWEAHPDTTTYRLDIEDKNKSKREAYIKGYDQAVQDFLEKACEWLHHNTMRELVLDSESTELVEDFVDDFKNYMQDE